MLTTTLSASKRAPQSRRGKGPSLERAIAHARTGLHQTARSEIIALLDREPNNGLAWLWLACVTENPWEALTSLQKVQELTPAHAAIRSGISWVQEAISAGRRLEPMTAPFLPREKRAEPAGARAKAAGNALGRWPIIAGILIVSVLVVGVGIVLSLTQVQSGQAMNEPARSSVTVVDKILAPVRSQQIEAEAEEAWIAEDWPAAVSALQRLIALEPSNTQWRTMLFQAQVKEADRLAQRGRLEDALAAYDTAMSLRPFDGELQQARGLAARYQIGLQRYEKGDWAGAADVFGEIFDSDSHYRETKDLLYSAHFNQGIASQAAGEWEAAEEHYLLAMRYRDDAVDVENRLMQVREMQIPPAPPPSARRIEISISQQRLYAYENDQLIYAFVCSTGYDASPTAPGEYRIQSKMPMAYASTWSLQMPYWMGIYWSGTLENGIHALPILPSGQILWDGYLGQRVSYGCIILSTEDARTLYDWAEIGDTVIIRY